MPHSNIVLAEDTWCIGMRCSPASVATVMAPRNFRGSFAIYLEGGLRPDHRGKGAGRAVLQWQLARGAEIHAEQQPGEPARLVVSVPEKMTCSELAAGVVWGRGEPAGSRKNYAAFANTGGLYDDLLEYLKR